MSSSAPKQQKRALLSFKSLTSVILVAIIAISAKSFYGRLRRQSFPSPTTAPASYDKSLPKFLPDNQSQVCISLSHALPESVYSSHHPTFGVSATSYWSSVASALQPDCIVQPADVEEVSVAVRALRAEYDGPDGAALRFAVRSGGHSPEAGFASINGGVLVELSLLNTVSVADDRSTVKVGTGARWGDASTTLDALGLALVGGRNSRVGVGGLALGGGISFFSPRFGMVCDNIEDYEIVLANGTITHVSATRHEDLWRALKGGTGNFGIVTSITAKIFPAGDIWSGYSLYLARQGRKLLTAFQEFNQVENFDEYAAGPILALAYVQSVGLRLVSLTLTYTKPVAWAPVFDRFKAIWRLWSTNKVKSLSSATDEVHGMAPYGQRQFQVTTTIKNDLDTLFEFRQIFEERIKEIKHVKSGVWGLVFQPLSPAVTKKGSPNVLGFETRAANETIVVVLLSVGWADSKDDELVYRISRDLLQAGEECAEKRGTADPYRYLNYAASGQDPFSGYGEENKQFILQMSRKYDPTGFFQHAKQGGFKIDIGEK